MAYGSTEMNVGADGDKAAHDSIGGAEHYRNKAGFGVEGSYTDASQATPFPVDDATVLSTLGLVAGRIEDHKFGYNPTVTVTEVDIHQLGGTINWPTAATTVRVKAGGNAADTAAGAGARKVLIFGLDATFALASESVDTAGASASASTSTAFFRVYRAYVTDCGTYGDANTGDMTIEDTAGANDLLKIDAEEGQTLSSQYSVPAGKTLVIKSGVIVVETAKPAHIHMYIRENFDDATSAPFTAKRIQRHYASVVGPFELATNGGIVVPEKSDVWFAAHADSGTTGVSVDYSILLVDN